MIYTVKGFGIVNKAEGVFLEVSCFSNDPTDVGNFINNKESNCQHLLDCHGEGLETHSSALACKNPMDGGAWAEVHGVAKSRTRLSDFTFTFHVLVLEKEMATHSSVLAWRIPGMEKPGRLPSMGSHRVRHN